MMQNDSQDQVPTNEPIDEKQFWEFVLMTLILLGGRTDNIEEDLKKLFDSQDKKERT